MEEEEHGPRDRCVIEDIEVTIHFMIKRILIVVSGTDVPRVVVRGCRLHQSRAANRGGRGGV